MKRYDPSGIVSFTAMSMGTKKKKNTDTAINYQASKADSGDRLLGF